MKNKFDGFKLAEDVLASLHGHIQKVGPASLQPGLVEQFTNLFKIYYVLKDEYGDEGKKPTPLPPITGGTPPVIVATACPTTYPYNSPGTTEAYWDAVKVGGTALN